VTFTWRDTSLGSRDPCYPYLFCTEQVGDWTLYCIVAADWSVGVCVCTTALIQQGFCEETYFREVFFLIRNPLRNAFKDVSQAKILFQNGSWFCVRHPKGGGDKICSCEGSQVVLVCHSVNYRLEAKYSAGKWRIWKFELNFKFCFIL